MSERICLVTGATGYVGGRLVPFLLERGWQVRVLVRHPERIRQSTWHSRVQVVPGDASDPAAMSKAMEGVDTAYFLMHSLNSRRGFADQELEVARNFASSAAAQQVSRIIYLGGLVPRDLPTHKMSEHMRSRAMVGEVLRGSGVSTVELRAAVILGSGSASFEMLRYLTERLPVMVTPRWVKNSIQPIAIADVLHYLVQAAELPGRDSRVFEIGGPDVLSYRDMMKRYAQVAGLRKRRIFALPLLTPRLSSRWVGLVTPVPAAVARPLVESIRHDAICTTQDSQLPAPAGGCLDFDTAVRRALAKIQEARVDTRWTDASVPGAPSEPLRSDPDWSGGSMYRDERDLVTTATASQLWQVIDGIGGANGWYSWRYLWAVRGWMDRVVGGVGLRRGRRNPTELAIDDACDFWRVEDRVPGQLLRLRAEMKLPGLAWLEFSIEGIGDFRRLRQRAIFVPRGLAGHMYWWAVSPFHGFIFGSMISNIVAAATAITVDECVAEKVA